MRQTLVIVLALIAAAGCSSQSQTGSPLEPSLNGDSFASPLADSPRVGTMATIVDVPVSVQNTAGTVGTWNWVGQSVTMPSGGSYASIRFAWYHSRPSGVPTAFGRLYALDRPYFGLPGDLGPSTPGFLAVSEPQPSGVSTAQGTEYELPATLTLLGGKQYWFYTDAQGAFATSFYSDLYDGGEMFLTGTDKLPFHQGMARFVNGQFEPPSSTNDANFRLRGVAR
jgi:hypothetical protein